MDYKKETTPEVWRDIDGYVGLYQVSNLGRVKSLARKVKCGKRLRDTKEQILTPCVLQNGYLLVVLCNGGEKKNLKVHRVVASAFIPNPENKPEIDHIDGNRTNNSVSNLRWVTRFENSRNPLLVKNYLGVIQYDLNGNEIARFDSVSQAARENKMIKVHIYQCARHKKKYKTAGGYKWEFIKNKK